jgi:hypothetical protein
MEAVSLAVPGEQLNNTGEAIYACKMTISEF